MSRPSPSGPNSSATPSLQQLRASRGATPSVFRRFRGWIIAGGVVVFLILFGFFGLPPIAKAQAIKRLSARLGREVTIEKIRINPLALSATIEGFAIAEADPATGEFTGWRRFHANLDSWPLIVGKVRFQTIELDGFRARVAKAKDGGHNFDDVVARLLAGDPSTTATTPSADSAATAEAKPTPLSVGKLSVTDARVSFDDASRERAFATVVGPLTFTLENFHTVGDPDSPYQFEAVTAAGERIGWKGTLSADPVKSRGELVLANIDLARLSPYYHQLVKGELRSAFADVSGRYTFELKDGVPVVTLADGALTLRDVRFGAPGVEADAFALKRLSVTGVAADSTTLRASAAKVAVEGVQLKAVRDAQGIDLLRLVSPVGVPSSGAGSPTTVTAATPPAPAPAAVVAGPTPRVTLGEFSLSGVQVEVTDLTTSHRVEHRVEDVQFTVRDLDSGDLAKLIPLSLVVKLPNEGRVSVSGAAAAQPLAAELDVALEKVSFANASPYVEPFLNIRVAGGALRTAGKVTLRDGKLGFAGDVGVSGFATVDGKQAEDFVKWSDLAVTGILLGSEPPTLHADLIRLADPSATLRIESDGTLNIARAGAPKPASTAAPKGPVARQPEKLPATKPARGPLTGPVVPRKPLPIAVTVDRFEIAGGTFRYEDRSIRPIARGALTSFSGSVSGLSSESLGRADVDLRGQVDGVAPVAITGKLNPLGTPAFVDLKIDFRGIDLQPGAGPYVGKFAGRELSRGNLALAIKASIADRKVDMANLITLDQFYLGAKTNSPDATTLPVGLALSLLRDTQGKIVLDVPVKGSFDDPEFRISRVVVRVLVNILAKAATSPFSLLGAAFGGGGDELGWQDFAAGATTPDDAGIKKLETVAKALNARPGLSLDIAGGYDPVSDLAALRRARLDREVRAAAWDARRQVDPNTPPPDEMTITPELHAGMVARLYAEAFPLAEGTPPPRVQISDGVVVSPFTPAAPSSSQDASNRRMGRLPKYSTPTPRSPGPTVGAPPSVPLPAAPFAPVAEATAAVAVAVDGTVAPV
ncbi:MAG: DUF748 domain-containing protein, partial [Burkholderiales bacterium]|nr:DUF748 domain-containing protein [Opitutaceae bacterium]